MQAADVIQQSSYAARYFFAFVLGVAAALRGFGFATFAATRRVRQYAVKDRPRMSLAFFGTIQPQVAFRVHADRVRPLQADAFFAGVFFLAAADVATV
ncbi:MAG: hypothetical protein AAGC70_02405 [Pseudomonadota bacterium]